MPLSGHHDIALFERHSKRCQIDMKIDDVILTSLRSETTYKLIYRVPGSRLLISRLPGKALRMHVESLSPTSRTLDESNAC